MTIRHLEKLGKRAFITFVVALILALGFQAVHADSQRSIVVDGITVHESDIKQSWTCSPRASTEVFVEVGTFDSGRAIGGFVLYDGGDSGVTAVYGRQGLYHRWDWGLLMDDGGLPFAIVIRPDGVGAYYDFSSSEKKIKKQDFTFECKQTKK